MGSEVDRSGERWTCHYGYVFDFGFVKLYNMGNTSAEVTAAPLKVLKDVAKLSPEIAIFTIVGDIPGRQPENAYAFVKLVHT